MPSGKRVRIVEAAATALFCAVAGLAGFRAALPAVGEEPVPASLMLPWSDSVPVVRIFDDFQCAACDRFDLRVAPRLRELERVGRIRIEYYHTPLSRHERSAIAAAAVLCVSPQSEADARSRFHQEKHWMYSDDPVASVVSIAGALGTGLLTECMRADSTLTKLNAQAAFGKRSDIRVVPTVWLDGSRLHFRSYASLLRRIEEASR